MHFIYSTRWLCENQIDNLTDIFCIISLGNADGQLVQLIVVNEKCEKVLTLH